MPEEVAKTARKQLERLKQMAQVVGRVHSAADLPRVARRAAWNKQTEDRLELEQARTSSIRITTI